MAILGDESSTQPIEFSSPVLFKLCILLGTGPDSIALTQSHHVYLRRPLCLCRVACYPITGIHYIQCTTTTTMTLV